MDQIKIGKFIKDRRKLQGLTQRELADKLMLSEKTISKWETGNGLPDVSLMMPLCEILKINVNELLSGERLTIENFESKANENLMNVLNEKKEAKKKFWMTFSIVMIVLLSAITLVCIASIIEMPLGLRIALIVIALVVLIVGIVIACMIDATIGVYTCPECGESFVPNFKSYLLAMHMVNNRYLKCPHCGKRHWCKRKINENEN